MDLIGIKTGTGDHESNFKRKWVQFRVVAIPRETMESIFIDINQPVTSTLFYIFLLYVDKYLFPFIFYIFFPNFDFYKMIR